MEGERGKKKMEGESSEKGVMAKDKSSSSSFSVTCNLLSQYLKEKKGGLPALVLDMAPPAGGVFRPPTTMNLLSGFDASAEEANATKTATEPRPSNSDLSIEKGSTDPPVMVPAIQQKGENSKEEAQQLTIFYGGKVVVFDNFPSSKVKNLLQMANIGDAAVNKLGGSPAPPRLPRTAQNNIADLPIARRNSLHSFLEKRKGRIIATAPYQVDGSMLASKKTMSNKSGLGLGQQMTVKQKI